MTTENRALLSVLDEHYCTTATKAIEKVQREWISAKYAHADLGSSGRPYRTKTDNPDK